MLSTMVSGLLRLIFSTTIQSVSIWSSITELAFLNSFSCLASIPFHHAASPVYCSLDEDTGHNRRSILLQTLKDLSLSAKKSLLSHFPLEVVGVPWPVYFVVKQFSLQSEVIRPAPTESTTKRLNLYSNSCPPSTHTMFAV